MKSPNQIVFNPAARDLEHMDEGIPMSSAKKIVRKVKKAAPSTMSKSDSNPMAFASKGAGVTNSRVMSGNSHSTAGASIKSQTLKSHASTSVLTKSGGLNNVRLK